MLMVYPRSTYVKRKFSRYLKQYPELFIGKLESVYLVKNCGKGIALVLAEMEIEQGNIEVYISEPLRIEQVTIDARIKEIASWLREKEGHQILKTEKESLQREVQEKIEQLERKRFSVQLNLQ